MPPKKKRLLKSRLLSKRFRKAKKSSAKITIKKSEQKVKADQSEGLATTSDIEFENFKLDMFIAEAAGKNAMTYRTAIEKIFEESAASKKTLNTLYLACAAASTKERMLEALRNILEKGEEDMMFDASNPA